MNIQSKLILILTSLDNLILDNYDRKFATYLEIGWDSKSIKEFLKNKANILKIASFNTPTITFTASSRINRYYEIYNRDDMILKDKPIKDSIESLKELCNFFKIFILANRTEKLKNKTTELLKSYSFPIDEIEIFYLKENQSFDVFRRNIIENIYKNYPNGFIIILDPREVSYFKKYNYKIIGFTSIYESKDFTQSKEEIELCRNWNQILSYLKLTKDEMIIQHSLDLTSEFKIEINKVEEIKADSMLEEAIYQQLFLGVNRIMGIYNEKNSQQQKGIVIAGIGKLLKNFINELKLKFKLIYEKKIDDFITSCEQRFNIDLKSEKNELESQLSIIDDWESQKLTMIYVVLTKILESFRRNAFEYIGLKSLLEIYREFLNNPVAQLPSTILMKLKKLSDINDEDIVLLNNLAFLCWLSKFYNDVDIYINIERIMTNLNYKILLFKLMNEN